MAISTGAAIIGGSLLSGFLGSKAQQKAADKQAQSIKNAQGISEKATQQAISSIFNTINPALASFNDSMQGSINLLNQGRISSSQLLNQGYQNASNIMAQGGNNAIAAMLGVPPQQAEQYQYVPQQIAQQVQSGQIEDSGLLPPRTETGEFGMGLLTREEDYNPWGQPADSQPLGQKPVSNSQFARQMPRGGGLDDIGPQPTRIISQTQPVNQDLPQQQFGTTPNQVDFSLQSQNIGIPQGTGAGLSGAEQAILGGAMQGRQDLMAGTQGGLDALRSGFDTAIAQRLAGGEFGLNQITQAMNAANQGFGRGVNTVLQGADRGAAAAQAGAAQGVGFLSPYMKTGEAVQQDLLALSGALGQEAFDRVRLNDPAYLLALEESERALGRQAALTSGLGSGNIMAELQRNAQMQAAADVDRQFGRRFGLSEAGRAAASTAGGLTTQAGIAAGGMLSSGAQAAGGIQAQQGQFNAGLRQAMANIGINTAEDLAAYAAQRGMTEQQVINQLGQNLANIDIGTGNTIGNQRLTTGMAAADLINQNAMNQAGLQTGLAGNLSNLDQQTLANIVNSIQQGAGTGLNTATNIAGMLSNTYLGQGSQAVNLAQNLGAAQAAGVTNPIGNAINTGLGLYASGAFNNNKGLGDVTRPGGLYNQTATVMQ